MGTRNNEPALMNTYWSPINRIEVTPQPSAPALTNTEYDIMYNPSHNSATDFQMQFHDRSHNDNLPVAVAVPVS